MVENVDSLLQSLNEEQSAAVKSTDGCVRLIAGAGSGKTHTLTTRLAYIIEGKGVAPERVLSLTFTNKAADEMKSRACKMMNVKEDENLSIMTFHKLALKICEQGIKNLGWDSFNVSENSVSVLLGILVKKYESIYEGMEEEDKRLFFNLVGSEVRKLLKDPDYVAYLSSKENLLSGLPLINPVDIVNTAKRAMLDFQEDRRDRFEGVKGSEYSEDGWATKAVYNKVYNRLVGEKEKEELKSNKETEEGRIEYKRYKQRMVYCMNKPLDLSVQDPIRVWAVETLRVKSSVKNLSFDDLIATALYLLKNFDDVRDYWQDRYDYIQVDEFQDTDEKQLGIARILQEKHGNLFVVGDPDQSIYAFRGTKPGLFTNLEGYFPNLKTIYMTRNYRSTEEIVKVSDDVIKINQNRIEKESVSQSGKGDKVEILSSEVISDTEKEAFSNFIKDKLNEKYTQKSVVDLANRDLNEYARSLVNQKRSGKGVPKDLDKILDKCSKKAYSGISDEFAKMISDKITDLIDSGVASSNIAVLYRSIADDTTGKVQKYLLEKNIPLNTTYEKKDLVVEMVKNATFEYLKYAWSHQLSFLNSFLVEIVGSESDIDVYVDVEALNIESSSFVEDLKEIIISTYKRLIVGDPSSRSNSIKISFASKLEERCSHYIEEVLEQWNSLSDTEKNRACSASDKLLKGELSNEEGVRVLTMHKAKGLEWDYVFVMGLTSSLMPGSRALSSDDMEESARLAYVAYSRAKKKLFLCVDDVDKVSPFVAKIFNGNEVVCNDTEFSKKLEMVYEDILKEYYESLDKLSIPKYYKLVSKNGVEGYRCEYYEGGRFESVDVSVNSLLQSGIPEPMYCQGSLNVVLGEDGHLVTISERSTGLIYELQDTEKIKKLFG